MQKVSIFVFNDTATTEIYPLSLHDALPISLPDGRAQSGAYAIIARRRRPRPRASATTRSYRAQSKTPCSASTVSHLRSEEHTSELQSRQYLVCRLLLEKKKTSTQTTFTYAT